MARKIVRWVAIGLVAIVILAVAGAFLMPRYRTVERSVDIDAPAGDVFAVVSDLRRFNEWSPWFGRDPEATYTFTGPADGVGQTFHWESDDPDVGSGSMEVASITPDDRVDIALDFADQGTAETWFTVVPEGAGSTVTWAFSTDLGFNPIGRYFGPMIDDMVGADYEAGLQKLKTLAETPPPEAPDEE